MRFEPLLSDIDLKQINFRRVQFKIKLKYKITQANIQKIVLKEPYRLCIDVFREYTITNELKVTKNITLTQKLIIGKEDKLFINELLIDKNSKDVSLKVALANGDTKSREKLSVIAQKQGAVAAINGGYFAKEGGPLGLIIINGKIVSENIKKRPTRTCFGITMDKKFIFDRVYAQDDKISTKDGTKWDEVIYAIGAGPRLIKNGEININAEEEALGKGGNDITKKAGRSAIGVTSEDKLILMTVSGYTGNEGQGVTLYPLASRLQKLDTVEAMNLDGGGSTAMFVQDQIISAPPEAKSSFERKVADGFLVFDSSENLLPYKIELEIKPNEIIADGVSEIGINAFVYTQNGNPVPDGTPVFFITNAGNISVAAKTSNGLAHGYFKPGRKTGFFKLTAKSGFVEQYANILFIADKPAFIFADAAKDTEDENKLTIEALIMDKYYNPIGNKDLVFSINGKEYSTTTGDDGTAKINIDAAAQEKTNIIIKSTGLEDQQISL